MLPSTGYFKTINCPFYDSGLCERPYCHFRHVKRDSSSEVATTSMTQSTDSPVQKGSDAGTSDPTGSDILQKLVSEAVKKVLQHSEILTVATSTASDVAIPQELVSQVVEELKPSTSGIGIALPEPSAPRPQKAYLPPTGIPSYKPTPISELKKRHIPVPYTPSPAPRGSSKIQVKRSSPSDDLSKIKRVKSDVECSLSSPKSEISLDYGLDIDTQATYSPIALQYSPSHNGWNNSSKAPSYIPSSIETLPKCSNDYVPSSLTVADSVDYQYCPTDKSRSSAEPNYVPEGSGDSSHEYTPTVKCDLEEDVVDIDLTTEFDILEEILNETSIESDKLKEKNEKEHVTNAGSSKEAGMKLDTAKPDIEIVKQVSKDSSHRSKHKERSRSCSQPDTAKKKESSSKHSEKLKSKKHSSDEKDHNPKKHDRNKHSSSSISEHRKSYEKTNKCEKGDRSERKESSEIRSKKHHKARDESKGKETGKEHHARSSERHSEKHSDSKSHSKGKGHTSESRSKREDKGHRQHSSKSSSKGHHHSSKYSEKELKKSSRRTQSQESGKVPGSTHSSNGTSEEQNSSSDVDTADVSIQELVTITVTDSGSETDEDTITKECYKIFQEYEPQQSQHKKTVRPEKSEKTEEQEPVLSVKKRIAREMALNYPPQTAVPAKQPPNPMQVMNLRLAKIREIQEKKSAELSSTVTSGAVSLPHRLSSSITSGTMIPSTSAPSSSTGARVRIAHVPNVSLLLSAKNRMKEQFEKRRQSSAAPVPVSTSKSALPPAESAAEPSHTVSQTVAKGGQRVAHKPSATVISQPKVFGELGGKIPANVRQSYLNHLVSEYTKICQDSNDAYSKAIEEEATIYNRSTTRSVYSSHMSNKINRLRKEAAAGSAPSTSSSEARVASLPGTSSQTSRTVSHSAILAGNIGAKGTWSVKRQNKTQGGKKSSLPIYTQLSQYILTDELLCSNGFPRAHPEEKGVAIIHLPPGTSRKAPSSPSLKRTLRVCCRCNHSYTVNKNGFQIKDEQCVYHWGRMFQMKVLGGWERRYTCCNSDGESGGCLVAACHVCDGFDADDLRGFVRTLPRDQDPPDGDFGVYALDCEMCYTTVGLELSRVTVIDQDMNTVYETLVKPGNPIIDYNTRFSGIKEEDMTGVHTSIYDVQATLLSFIYDKTILIGHSLESDFKALKLIHSTVVDTSVVFPHKQGPPKKRALKTLCREHLNKIIQESVDGHDSAEDAKACMELMLWKLKDA
ncbi:RNA exonuclease 1 homolog [Periplaneta americana]|uniref:RNA exonuclease 1 homolog n=1 Tax=Periplaneta americana TaxID=6978 RepID=UPI0037E74816